MALNFPDSPSNGDTTTLNGVSYTYDSTKTVWVSTTGPITTVAVSDTAPTTPTDGDMWFNSSDLKLYIRYNDGATSQWIIAAPAGPAGADSTVAGPAGPAGGDGRAGVYADMAALIAKTGMVAGDQALVTALNKVFMYTGSAWFLIATMTNDSPSAITGVDGSYALATDGTATTITAVSTDPEGFPLTWSYAVTTGSLGSTATVSQADNVFTVTPSTNSAHSGNFSITFSVTDGATGAVSAVSVFTLAFIVTNSRYTALSVRATNTGSNQTFDDASTSNHTITASDATASTFSPYRAGGYSAYFDNPTVWSYLRLPDTTLDNICNDTTASAIATHVTTIEAWVYPLSRRDSSSSAYGGGSCIITKGYTWFNLGIDHDGYVHCYHMSGGSDNQSGAGYTENNIITSNTVPLNDWTHVAAVIENSQIKVYVNGVLGASGTWNGLHNYASGSSRESSIGAGVTSADGPRRFDGYICDFRISDNARYTSNFTQSTEFLTVDSDTDFLLGNLPYFKDQSASNHAITVTGNVSLEPKSVFDNMTYSESSHGASVYFDGTTGNRLTIPHHADFDFSGDYVLEFWFNLEQTSHAQWLFNKSSGSEEFQIYTQSANNKIALWMSDSSSNTIVFYSNQGPVVEGTGWHHFSLVRDNSAGTYVSYLDGVVINTTTSAYNSTSTTEMRLGALSGSSTGPLKGYMSDVKFLTTIPSDRNAAFTLPTSPSTPDSYTKFLLNPETSISDLSQKSEIACFGDAATSTTQVKFAGTKSIYLDGTGDFLQSSESVNIAGDWTIEGWYYFTTLAADHSFFTIGDSSSQANSMEFLYRGASINELRFYNMGSGYSNQHTPPADFLANNWIHIAVVRSGTGTNNIKAYINGTQSGTGKTSNNDLIGKVNIGTELYNGAGSWFTQGYIQDFRVSSIARYTSNFTPPTAELEG